VSDWVGRFDPPVLVPVLLPVLVVPLAVFMDELAVWTSPITWFWTIRVVLSQQLPQLPKGRQHQTPGAQLMTFIDTVAPIADITTKSISQTESFKPFRPMLTRIAKLRASRRFACLIGTADLEHHVRESAIRGITETGSHANVGIAFIRHATGCAAGASCGAAVDNG
jgi:hypothetical protein